MSARGDRAADPGTPPATSARDSNDWDDPAGSSEWPRGATVPGEPKAIVGEPRFEERDALGVGGGGRVVRGVDRYLERDVALKIVAADNPQALARLRREAAILVTLEHPGIVPLYDMVERPDGGLQLALRIVRGRSLDRLLVGAPGERRFIAERVRYLARAAEAVAWAHHKGFVHRDLKPSNIMVGEFGEVQVIDWGLAARAGPDCAPLAVSLAGPIDDASLPRKAQPDLASYAPDLTRAGAVLGTPRYMSPEQARGERVDQRADVWSLGAILFELIAGRPAFSAADAGEVLAAVRQGSVPDLRRLAPSAPHELVAVVLRAMEPEPELRYPNGRGFAEDLNAWLDGRPVAAHRYRLRQRVARFVKRRRLPLALVGGAIATLVAFVAAPQGARQIVEDTARAEALAGEVAARERHLADALAREADELFHQGRLPEAATVAARSLALASSPEARGVIALVVGAQDARHLSETPLQVSCLSRALHPDGERWLCRTGDEVSLWRGDRLLWRHRGGNDGAALVAGGARVVLLAPDRSVHTLDVASGALVSRSAPQDCGVRLVPGAAADLALLLGRHCLVVLDGERPTWVYDGPAFQAAATTTRGDWALLTMDGTLVSGVHDAAGPAIRPPAPRVFGLRAQVATPLGTSALDVSAMVALDDEVVLGTLRGALIRVGRDGLARASHVLTHDVPVTAIAASPSGDTLVIQRDRGGPLFVSRESLQLRAVLPADDAGAAWLVDDRQLVSVSARRLAHWDLGARRLGALRGLHGLVTIALSDDLLAVGHDRWLTLFGVPRGEMITRLAAPNIIKSIALHPDGHEVAWSPLGASAIERYDTRLGALVGWPAKIVSRLGFSDSGVLLALPYQPELWVVPPGDPEGIVAVGNDRGIDLEVHATRAALLTRTGEALLLDVAAAPLELARCAVPGAVALALMPTEPILVAATQNELWLVDAERCGLLDLLLAQVDGRPLVLTDVQTSADGRWIAAATREGYVLVWDRAGTPLAKVRAHAQRVARLAFAPDGRRLLSAGWDGAVQVLDLATLVAPAATLADLPRTNWGL